MDPHRHEGFEIPDDMPPGFEAQAGRPVDRGLISAFVAAVVDGCTSCQSAYLPRLVEDPATTYLLVAVACVTAQTMFGGLPASMYDEDGPGGLSSPEFWRLARAGLDEAHGAAVRVCELMTNQQRQAAVDTAADQLVGYLIARYASEFPQGENP